MGGSSEGRVEQEEGREWEQDSYVNKKRFILKNLIKKESKQKKSQKSNF